MNYTATNKETGKTFTEKETYNWHPFGLAGEILRQGIATLKAEAAADSVNLILGWNIRRA